VGRAGNKGATFPRGALVKRAARRSPDDAWFPLGQIDPVTSSRPPVASVVPSAARRALEEFASFAALSAEEKRSVAEEIAAELGDDFRVGPELVGEARLPTLVHVRSGVELVVIPGGTFVRGLTDDDRAAIERYFDRRTEGEVFAFVEKHLPAMSPAREVRVRPFAIAREALVDPSVVGFEGEGSAAGQRLSEDEAVRRVARAGFRLPSEAEWELVAREGRGCAFVLDAAATFWDGAAERTETAWGIVEPERTIWLGDRWHPSLEGAPVDGSAWTTGDGPRMQRGSFPWGLRMIEGAFDLVYALTAIRFPPLVGANINTDVWIRPALGPDETGRWRLARSLPETLGAPVAASPPVAAPVPAAPDPAVVELLKRYAAVDAMDLDAALDALATVQQPDLNHVVRRCLLLCGYPTAGDVPLAEELTPDQRRVMEATTKRSGIGWSPGVPVPVPVQIRRRWLGIDPPSVLERTVEIRRDETTVRWPLWKAWVELRRTGRDEDGLALLPSLVDRFEAAILVQTWGPGLYGLPADDRATPLCRALGPAGAVRAASLLDELLAVHRLVVSVDAESGPPVERYETILPDPNGRAPLDRPHPIRESVWGALLVAVVAGGAKIEKRWEPVLPFVQPYLTVCIGGIAEERRDAALVAAFRRAAVRWALPVALDLLRTGPSVALAEQVARSLESRDVRAEYGAKMVAGWVDQWNGLATVLPEGRWRRLVEKDG
jgi:hypothetical protein